MDNLDFYRINEFGQLEPWDTRILSLYYGFSECSILMFDINPENIELQLQWSFTNFDMSGVKEYIDRFHCKKLVNNHEYLLKIITSYEVVDLEVLSEIQQSQLDDLFLSIKSKIKKGDETINIQSDADVNCLKQFVYKYANEIVKFL